MKSKKNIVEWKCWIQYLHRLLNFRKKSWQLWASAQASPYLLLHPASLFLRRSFGALCNDEPIIFYMLTFLAKHHTALSCWLPAEWWSWKQSPYFCWEMCTLWSLNQYSAYESRQPIILHKNVQQDGMGTTYTKEISLRYSEDNWILKIHSSIDICSPHF